MKKKAKKSFFENLKDKLQMIATIFLIFGVLFGAWMFLENRYAQKKVESKLDYVKYSLQFQMNNNKIAALMATYPNIETADPIIKEQLQALMDTKAELTRKMDALEKLGIGM